MYTQTGKMVEVTKVTEVLPTREARKRLSGFLRESRERGVDADPVFFGAHRKPEAVVLSYAAYQDLVDALDDVLISREVAARDAVDSGERMDLVELIRSQGFEPADFGL
jgi:PHD/YefM family antitoxin component YafN of YafNO toxin-antitoxin module